MKAIAIALTLLTAIGLAQELPKVADPAKLRRAPEFILTDLEGEEVKRSKIEGDVVVLHFWSKFRDCDTDLKVLQRLHKKYRPRGVAIVGLAYSSGERDDVAAFLQSLEVDIPTLMCTSETKHDYDVATFPTTFLLDDQGRIRYWMYGILVEQHWDDLIAELMAEG